jgi:hypothetical protein
MVMRWFNAFAKERRDRKAVRILNMRIDLPAEAHDPAELMPIVVPLSFADLDWPGPIDPIGELPFALTWALVGKGNSWIYVSHEQSAYWDGCGVDWQAKAFRNLRDASRPGSNGEKCDAHGRPFLMVMLQKDATGPSRLLLPNLFVEDLGADYLVAIPERTCAVAYRRNLSAEEQTDVDAMINGCFQHGTEPVSPERFRASEFWGSAGGVFG